MPPAPEDRLAVPAVARLLGVTPEAVLGWAKKGVRGRVLPSFLMGGRRFVRKVDLEAFHNALNAPPAKGA